MSNNIIKAQDVFLGKINQLCGKFGLNNIMAEIYTLLYLRGEPLSLDDIAERLKISKSSVSVNIRVLERYRATKRVWVKGSRKDYYEAETDIRSVIIERIRSMVDNRMTEVDDLIKSSYEALDSFSSSNSGDNDSIKIFKERLDGVKGIYDQAKTLYGFLDAGLSSNAFGKPAADETKAVQESR